MSVVIETVYKDPIHFQQIYVWCYHFCRLRPTTYVEDRLAFIKLLKLSYDVCFIKSFLISSQRKYITYTVIYFTFELGFSTVCGYDSFIAVCVIHTCVNYLTYFNVTVLALINCICWTHIATTSLRKLSLNVHLLWIINDVTWVSCYRESAKIRLFVHHLVQISNNENTKALHHWPFVRKIHRSPMDSTHKWANNVENLSMQCHPQQHVLQKHIYRVTF